MPTEPGVSWNLLLSIIAFPSLGWFLKREFTNIQEEARTRTKALTSEIEKLRDCMTTVKVDVEGKMSREECDNKAAEKWERIYHHKHDADGAVVVTS